MCSMSRLISPSEQIGFLASRTFDMRFNRPDSYFGLVQNRVTFFYALQVTIFSATPVLIDFYDCSWPLQQLEKCYLWAYEIEPGPIFGLVQSWVTVVVYLFNGD